MTYRRVLTLALVITIAACGPSPRGRGDDDDDGSGSCTTAQMCSANLHDVVDCGGNVVMSCAPDQGCADGACVDACQAAATNSSSIGCDYYAVDPDMIEPGGCFAAYIANTWTSPITINVSYNGAALAIDSFVRIPSGQGQGLTYAPLTGGMLPPGQVAIVFLAESDGFVPCPITPAVTVDAQVHETGLGHAFHITTSSPVVAYDIAPYGGGDSAITSATLLLPTSAWDTNYVAVDAFKQSQLAGEPNVVVVAQNDNTHVTIHPIAAIVGGTGVAAAAASSSTTYVLSAGQSLQFEQAAELGGSPITSDQPIGVWGGASCLNIPIDIAACDAAHQQIPPVKAMGNHYAAVRYRNRFVGQEETVPWRLVGGVDGTTLLYSPAAPPGAPTTLALGQVVEIDGAGPFTAEPCRSGEIGAHDRMRGGRSRRRGLPRRPGVRQHRAARAVSELVHVLHQISDVSAGARETSRSPASSRPDSPTSRSIARAR